MYIKISFIFQHIRLKFGILIAKGLPNNIYDCQLGLMSENKMASSQLEHHLAGRGLFPGILLPCQSFIFQDIYLRLGMIKHKNDLNMCV